MSTALAHATLSRPAKDYWTYDDLAQVFGTTRTRRLMPEWERAGFPAPLPWSRKEKRWNPAAVLAWKARQELKHRATPPVIVENRP